LVLHASHYHFLTIRTSLKEGDFRPSTWESIRPIHQVARNATAMRILDFGRVRVLPPKRDSKRDKWIRWIGLIDEDVKTLAINRMAWRAMASIWKDRRPPLPSSFLFDYLAHTYAHTQAIGIRRQADVGRDVSSLARLLGEIRDFPDRISREFYVGRFPWGQQVMGDREFAKLDCNCSGPAGEPGVIFEQQP